MVKEDAKLHGETIAVNDIFQHHLHPVIMVPRMPREAEAPREGRPHVSQ